MGQELTEITHTEFQSSDEEETSEFEDDDLISGELVVT